MSTAPDHLTLAADFEPADRRAWQELVAAALRRSGRLPADAPPEAVEEALATATYDGVTVRPLYTATDAAPPAGVPGAAPFVRGRRPDGQGWEAAPDDSTSMLPTGWDVRQRHANPDVAATRAAVLADLENGGTSLWLALGPAGIPVEALTEVLDGVYLDLAPVVLDAGPDTAAAADALLALAEARGVPAEALTGNLGADPLGLRARTGAAESLDGSLETAVALAARCAADHPGLRAITVDATPYHDAGGSDAEELGTSLATGVAYLRALTDAGLDVPAALRQLEFRYAATANQFGTIAKFRAARRLWARVAEVCGVAPDAADHPDARVAGQRQHAVTSTAMLSRRDPWVNLLRGTLACFAAGVGGADAVTVQPFDAAIGLPDEFARRIARNTSSLLVMESGVARVIDPVGGSWYVENLTAGLAAVAWDWFTEIERAGGIGAALDSGLVARRLADTWDRRAKRLAVRADALTGVSEFPNLGEAPVVRAPYPAPAGGTAGDTAGGLPRHRYPEEYEALRDAADAATEAAGGTRPAVFLATLGPVAVHTARASFAANLFEAGGLATPRFHSTSTSTDPAEVAAAFTASGARVACLASSDTVYADAAGPVAEALRAAGARKVWLAGRPGEYPVDAYVHAGSDALAVLRDAHDLAGVTS